MDWTAEAIERLRALWSEGHSTAEIGRRMGVTKNAVVGKAHRLQLSARPSPIRREVGAPRPVATGRQPTLPPLRVVASLPRAPEPRAVVVPVAAAPAPRPSAVVRAFPRLGARACCWPIGEPGTPGFRFCSGEATTGKPYCAEHTAVAYVRVKDRREDAA